MKSISRKITSIFNRKNRSPEVVAREAEIKKAIRQLGDYTDRQLEDIGLTRGNIEHAVRYGIASNDAEYQKNTVA